MGKFRAQHMVISWKDMTDVDIEASAVASPLKEKAALVGRVGLMMLSCGTGAWRVRAAMNRISRALNVVTNADIGLLAISYTCAADGESITNALSIPTTGIDTDKLTALEHFTKSFADKADKYSAGQFEELLDKIAALPQHYNARQTALAAGFACAAFAFLLGGGLPEILLTFVGAFCGQHLRKVLLKYKLTLIANVTLSVASACIVYASLVKIIGLYIPSLEIQASGYICSMLFIIPGFPLITGGFDLAKMDLRSGLERLSYALLIIIPATLTGWLTAVIFGIAPEALDGVALRPLHMFLLRALASFVGVYGFSFLYNSTRRMALAAGIIGMIANLVRLELIEFTEIPVAAAAFIGAFCAGILASLMRSAVDYPRISMTVPSIVIMVPGMYLYKGIYFLGTNNFGEGGEWLVKAFMIIVSLPLGLIFARILTDNNFRTRS